MNYIEDMKEIANLLANLVRILDENDVTLAYEIGFIEGHAKVLLERMKKDIKTYERHGC